MPDQTPPASYHALLIGVDGYRRAPLGGCVNDIDAVERVLLGTGMAAVKARIRIRRLASPASGASRNTATAPPATLDNVRAALAALGSPEVAAGDRVFIYYAGHGARVQVTASDGRRFHREALVPVDYDADPLRPQLLYDHELNGLLNDIVARTRSVTLVLDCCHSAGATREGGASRDRQTRHVDFSNLPPLPDPAPASHGGTQPGAAFGAVEDCHVVAACLGHELAYEQRGPGDTRHGLLTGAFLAALEDSAASDLTTLTWARIWQAMYARVQDHNPWQHPSMIGNPARAVFAGPPVNGDSGLVVTGAGTQYRIAAGTLAGVTEEAEVAIYGERPPDFPPLGSRADHDARIGLLRVTSAGRAAAIAEALEPSFVVPAGARGRVVKAGRAARLTCTLVPDRGGDASVVRMLEAQIAQSPLVDLVKPPIDPEVRLDQRGSRWMITDSVHGGGDDGPVLFDLRPAELDCARAVLEHYHAYARPLRMAARASDLPGRLQLDVLSYPADRLFTAAEAQAANLPDAPTRGTGTYALQSGARVCFRVRNASTHRLRVTLLNSAASGKVQLLGDEIIDAGRFHVFWARGNLGSPFQMSPPPNAAQCIDRMVAIGRTDVASDLDHLRVDKSFAQVIQRTRDAGEDRDIDGADQPVEHWTSAQAIIETCAPRRP
jgi:hypothetical protein